MGVSENTDMVSTSVGALTLLVLTMLTLDSKRLGGKLKSICLWINPFGERHMAVLHFF